MRGEHEQAHTIAQGSYPDSAHPDCRDVPATPPFVAQVIRAKQPKPTTIRTKVLQAAGDDLLRRPTTVVAHTNCVTGTYERSLRRPNFAPCCR